jgi:hypothetical protein
MPNISETFGISLNGASSSLLKPVVPTKILPRTVEQRHDELSDESQAGTSKQQEEEIKPSIGLYEELLASSTGRY